MRILLREPLLHFALLGAGLFLVYDHFNRDLADSDPRTIVVSRDKLLNFLQYRSRAFDVARFKNLMDRMSTEELQQLIDAYVREEALYREAKALQLDRSDYVSRLRLIQQFEFIARGFADTQTQVTAEEVQHHYETHQAEYMVKPKVTFTHVFFSNERRGAQKAEALAREELRKLNHAQVQFDQAPAYGDRFLYHVNYVEQNPEEVASHFGTEMQAHLFALESNEKRWRGPFKSPYGAHVVLLTHHVPGYVPPLEDVRTRVEQDARRVALDARFEESIQSVVQTYKVQLNDQFALLNDNQKGAGEDAWSVPASGATGKNVSRR